MQNAVVYKQAGFHAVLPAVVSEDNCIYIFLTIGGRMPS